MRFCTFSGQLWYKEVLCIVSYNTPNLWNVLVVNLFQAVTPPAKYRFACTSRSEYLNKELHEMLINSFVLFFRLHGWNYLWLKAVKRRKGEIARDLAAVGHNILHFKLELRPKCWKSFLTVTAVDRWGVALSLPQIWASKLKIFLENQCWNHEYSFLNMIGAKLSDKRNS